MIILLVEDHKPSAEALCKILTRRMEYVQCEIAYNLNDAKRMSDYLKPDITLLDLNLPDAPVQQVIESIRDFTPPVIVVTDMEETDTMLECFKHGAQNYLSKRCLREIVDSFKQKVEAEFLIRSIIETVFRTTLSEVPVVA